MNQDQVPDPWCLSHVHINRTLWSLSFLHQFDSVDERCSDPQSFSSHGVDLDPLMMESHSCSPEDPLHSLTFELWTNTPVLLMSVHFHGSKSESNTGLCPWLCRFILFVLWIQTIMVCFIQHSTCSNVENLLHIKSMKFKLSSDQLVCVWDGGELWDGCRGFLFCSCHWHWLMFLHLEVFVQALGVFYHCG